MRFTIRKDHHEKEVEFWLGETFNTITLYAQVRGSDRGPWAILDITRKGLSRMKYIEDDLGFAKDDKKRIALHHED